MIPLSGSFGDLEKQELCGGGGGGGGRETKRKATGARGPYESETLY